jgi:hypothetical protein
MVITLSMRRTRLSAGLPEPLREQHDPLKIFTAKVKQHITKEELAAIDEEVEARAGSPSK